MKTVVLYHANCADGFCAAWLASKVYPDAEFIAVNYGEAPPMDKLEGNRVLILDFSYPRNQLVAIYDAAANLLVLDHHKTAEAELAGLDFCQFDMSRSGARMTFDFFKDRVGFGPRIDEIVTYVQDRDLWLWVQPHSKAVSAGITSYPFDFEVWDSFNISDLIAGGYAILRYQDRVVSSAVKAVREVVCKGQKVLCVNATTLISEIGNALALGRAHSISWFQRTDGKFVYSLRSSDSGADVSAIAKEFGGGGHRNAAGFVSDDLLWK